ncbi:MAG TPA: ABC transporter ATP-binding protein [Candidatus Limnocylindria bacterium]|jgi:nitrate/nitrite transport system ATP-binding protein|nr:ABC transporter ATP-binding protein [Candidatus Limnocylindria bacterium]
MPFLEIKNVSKSYPVDSGRTTVLKNINLQIEKGEFVAIVGYSGAGKTTLMNLIAGLHRPDTGTVTLNDLEIVEPGPDRGVVFQNYSLLPWLTVYENISLAVTPLFPNWSEAKRKQHVEKYIEMVHLSHAKEKRPADLSGGMRQRVSVARALAMEPQILLMDEPLGALDALTRATLQDEIGRICQESGKTVVLITNDPDEGIYLADRIIPLSTGPEATLGPSFTVDIERPRDRKAMNHDPRFKRIRNGVVEWLLGEGGRKHTTVTKRLVLPDIEPEDLSVARSPFDRRRRPIRKSERKVEKIEIN